jgi:hypothetical protein
MTPCDRQFQALYLAPAPLTDGIDVAYAYKPAHQLLDHALASSLLLLDDDRGEIDSLAAPDGSAG